MPKFNLEYDRKRKEIVIRDRADILGRMSFDGDLDKCNRGLLYLQC